MDLEEPYFQRNPKTFLNTQMLRKCSAAVTCYPSPNFLCPPGFVLADWLHSLRAHRLRCYFWSCSFGTRLRKTGLWKPHMHWWPRGKGTFQACWKWRLSCILLDYIKTHIKSWVFIGLSIIIQHIFHLCNVLQCRIILWIIYALGNSCSSHLNVTALHCEAHLMQRLCPMITGWTATPRLAGREVPES